MVLAKRYGIGLLLLLYTIQRGKSCYWYGVSGKGSERGNGMGIISFGDLNKLITHTRTQANSVLFFTCCTTCEPPLTPCSLQKKSEMSIKGERN